MGTPSEQRVSACWREPSTCTWSPECSLRDRKLPALVSFGPRPASLRCGSQKHRGFGRAVPAVDTACLLTQARSQAGLDQVWRLQSRRIYLLCPPFYTVPLNKSPFSLLLALMGNIALFCPDPELSDLSTQLLTTTVLKPKPRD